MRKKLLPNEIIGVIFTLSGYVFMKHLYAMTEHDLVGILFGCVNDSIWENTKALILPYIIWSLLEMLCLGSGFHNFVSVKIISAYFLALIYILQCLVFSVTGKPYQTAELCFAVLSVLLAFGASYVMLKSSLNLNGFFPVALCMLFLLMALYFSLTPFPMHNYLFMDRGSGLYGLLPMGYDYGANALDAIYYI